VLALGQFLDQLNEGVGPSRAAFTVDHDSGRAGQTSRDRVRVLLIDPVEVLAVVDALGELVGVEAEFSCDRNRSVARIGVPTRTLEVVVVELPPVVLVAGAFGRERGHFGGCAMIDDVPVLEAGQTGGHQLFFDARPNLGREMTAAASKEVGVLLDHDRRVGVAERGAIADDLDPRLSFG